MRTRFIFCSAVAVHVLLAASMITSASAQPRRRAVEPPAPAEPLPQITNEQASCSFAFHAALAPVRDGAAKEIGNLDRLARQSEPGLTGRWLFWSKAGRSALKPPQPERVCAQSVTKSGRERCIEWETKPVDAIKLALFAAQPSGEELTVLRALDAFVTDKGAALEFGSNGRQYATLQRVAVELEAYITQPKHPALCNGVQEMLEFKLSKIDGIKKRIDDVGRVAVKARSLARQRVIAARELRGAEETAAAQPKPADASSGAPSLPRSIPSPAVQIPATIDQAALLATLFDGVVPADKLGELRQEPTIWRSLQRARDLMAPEATPGLSPGLRASTVAALRMIEAASYGDLQVAHIQRFDRLFFGTINQIRDAHRTTCTCAR